MGNIHVKFYEIWTVVQKMIFKDALGQPLCSADQNHRCNLVEGIIRNNSVKLF